MFILGYSDTPQGRADYWQQKKGDAVRSEASLAAESKRYSVYGTVALAGALAGTCLLPLPMLVIAPVILTGIGGGCLSHSTTLAKRREIAEGNRQMAESKLVQIGVVA